MNTENDYLSLKLEVDPEGELILKMDMYFPSKDIRLFMSLTALGYGLTAIMEDSQEDVAQLGIDYMQENGITFEGLLSNNVARKRMH